MTREVTFTMSTDSKAVLATANRLGNGIANNSREVPGFLVNAVNLIRESGDVRPLLSFVNRLSDRDAALVVKFCGGLSGRTNKGKARLVYKKSENRFEWPAEFRASNGGTLDERFVSVLTDAHGKKDFRDRALSKTLFPTDKPELSDDEKVKKANAAVKKSAESLVELMMAHGVTVGEIRAALESEMESALAAARAAETAKAKTAA